MILIDAMNVLGSRADGWWRDRDGALGRLTDDLQAWAGREEGEVVVVADGRPPPGLEEGVHGAVTVRYATRTGRDAADDRIVALVEAAVTAGDAGRVEVVTADRGLRERVAALGAEVTGPRTLLDRLVR